MVDAVHQVEDEVRELIRRSGLDPTRHPREIDRLVREAVTDYDERSLLGGLPALTNLDQTVKEVLDTVAGFGPLQKYFDDPAIEEIWINEPSKVFVARGGVTELTTTILTADEVRDLVERMLRASGRRVDLSSPFVDATLPDGSRLHVVIPDINLLAGREWTTAFFTALALIEERSRCTPPSFQRCSSRFKSAPSATTRWPCAANPVDRTNPDHPHAS